MTTDNKLPRVWTWEELTETQDLEHGAKFIAKSDYEAALKRADEMEQLYKNKQEQLRRFISKDELLTEARALASALEFYMQGDNLDVNRAGIIWPTGIGDTKDWRIAPPYLKSAEMGQVARLAITRWREFEKGMKP